MWQPDELKKSAPLRWSTGIGTDVWAMFKAAMHGDLPALRRLLKKDPSLVRAHYGYRIPLYFAVRENQVAAAALLLERMSDPLSLAVNDTLLNVARSRGYTEMAGLLAERMDVRGEPLAAAIRQRNIRAVRRLLAEDPTLLHTRDERGNQPIHWAVMSRQISIINLLLDLGAVISSTEAASTATKIYC